MKGDTHEPILENLSEWDAVFRLPAGVEPDISYPTAVIADQDKEFTIIQGAEYNAAGDKQFIYLSEVQARKLVTIIQFWLSETKTP